VAPLDQLHIYKQYIGINLQLTRLQLLVGKLVTVGFMHSYLHISLNAARFSDGLGLPEPLRGMVMSQFHWKIDDKAEQQYLHWDLAV